MHLFSISKEMQYSFIAILFSLSFLHMRTALSFSEINTKSTRIACLNAEENISFGNVKIREKESALIVG